MSTNNIIKNLSENLFSLSNTIACNLFLKFKYPWEILSNIHNFILELGPMLPRNEYLEIKPNVWVSKDSEIFESVYIEPPVIIQKNTQIRHNSYIRGSVIIGENCVIGNSTEIKNSILFNNSQAPHFNYIGDSVLGYKSHLGAGVIISNLKSDKSNITVNYKNTKINTNLRKFGALIGDHVEIGCNSVLNPGTIISQNTTVYPLVSVRGFVEPNMIVKQNNIIINKI